MPTNLNTTDTARLHRIACEGIPRPAPTVTVKVRDLPGDRWGQYQPERRVVKIDAVVLSSHPYDDSRRTLRHEMRHAYDLQFLTYDERAAFFHRYTECDEEVTSYELFGVLMPQGCGFVWLGGDDWAKAMGERYAADDPLHPY